MLDYSSSEPTELMQFRCTVADNASGELTVGIGRGYAFAFTFNKSYDQAFPTYDPSRSAVTVRVPEVSFYVPEAVYLKTGEHGTQWYLNSCGDNGVRPPAPKDTTGKLYFHCDGATDIRITSDGAVVNLITTGTDTIADNDFQIVSDKGGRVTYTATYTAGGMTRTAKAYTYIYMPNRVPTGCATEAESKKHDGNYDYLGFLTALWGAQSSDTKENTSDTDGADVADESIYLGNHGLVKSQNHKPRKSGMVSAGNGTFGAHNNNDINLSVTSPTAYFCVDTSRFTNMKDIPNMYVGLTMTDDEHTDYSKFTTYLAAGHTSGQTKPACIAPIIPETQENGERVIRQEGECTIDYDVSALQSTETDFTVFTYGYSYCDTGSGYETNSYQHTHFQIRACNKNDLRVLYRDEMRNNYFRQKSFYESEDDWARYEAYMEEAAIVLGSPDVRPDSIRNCCNNLSEAIDGFKAKAPSITRTKTAREGVNGYWVYAQVETNGGAPIDRVQFPTWTDKNGQDDIQKNWENNSAASGTFGAWSVDGQQYNYMYYVDVSDHNNEYAGYNTHVYAYNVAGASAHAEADKVNFDYTVRFEGCGATGGSVAAQTVIYGESVTLPSVEREGYMFLGWAETANADAPQYQSGKTFKPSKDTTLYAVWGVAAPTKAINLVSGKAETIKGAQESSVWFGNYMQSSADSKEPVKWRVLENKDGKIFLLSDQNLDVFEYNKEYTSVTWETCDMRSWLNGYGATTNSGGNDYTGDSFKGDTFSAAEFAAVADSELENADNLKWSTSGGANTTDKVFLLSFADATNTAYGFTDYYDATNNYSATDTRVATDTAYTAGGGKISSAGMSDVGDDGLWWLRSPGVNDRSAAYVGVPGSLISYGEVASADNIAVRPAVNIDLGKVLFTSAAEGGKPDGGLTAIPGYNGADWKLTLLDDSRADFTASCTKDENGVRTITYSGAKTGENEKISAVIVSPDRGVTYYGVLENAKAGENTLTLDVSGKLDDSDKLYVFNEQVNGDKKTDYASALVDVTEKALTKYDLWVGGVQFDEDNLEINANDIPGVTGSATYDPENNELTLDGFQYTGEGYRYLVDPGTQNEQYYAAGIYYTGTDELTVRLVQENAVTVTGDATNSYGFRSENLRTAVTFTGTGSLTARGADNAQSISYGITVSGSLCVEKQATVTGVGGDSSKSSYGVTTYVLHTKLEVYGTLTGNGGSASNISCGVYGAEITVGTDAVLTAVGSAGDSSRGIIADSVTVRSGTVEAASGEGERYSLAFKAKTGDNIAFDLSDDLTMRAGESKDENEIVTGDGWKNQKYVLIGEPATFSVTVTAGENMTKTEDSGDASQTVEKDSAMTAVVYTANTGYYFPTDYAVDSVNGVSVTRDSYSQITVSGTPTGDAAITLPSPTVKPTPTVTAVIKDGKETFEYGETVIAIMTIPADATHDPKVGGDLTIYLNDKSVAAIDAENGTARYEFPTLKCGEYTLRAVYNGDDHYAPAESETTTFTVTQSEIFVDVIYDESMYVGETQEIRIELSSPLATGDVTVSLKGINYTVTTSYTVTMENGVGTFTTPLLDARSYLMTVSYPGDENHAACEDEFPLTVTKRTPELTMTAEPTNDAGTQYEITITKPEDSVGSVTFDVESMSIVFQNDRFENGAYTFLFPDVIKKYMPDDMSGEYELTARYDGEYDDLYESNRCVITVTLACEHVWKEPTWDWTQDVNNPTYTAECDNCGDTVTDTVESKAGKRVEATTDEDAYTPYTAEVTLGEQTFTDTFKAYEPGTAFEAYKQAQKKAADERALDGDSDEAAALIEAAKKAIDDVPFDETKTLDQNKQAVDTAANLAGLEKALTDQRAADAVEDKIEDIGDVELTDESKQKIDAAREAYDDLTDEQKDLVDNLDTLTDAEAEYEKLDNHAQFEQYKEDMQKAAGEKAQTGDSAESAQLIEDAKDRIDDVTYDETKSLDDNKKAVDDAANLAQLDADLAEHRAIHYADFYADGKPVESVPYTIDTKSITEPAVPEKTGYTGTWPSYTLKAGGVRIDAVYETIPYEATFYADSVLVDTVTYNVETTSIADKEPAVPEKPGHTGAWPEYTLKVGGTRIDAVYEVIMQTVDFDPNGGFGEMESVTTAWGSTITLPECTFTAPNGKEFDKWDAGDPGDEVEVKSDLTVKAVWKEKPLTLTADVDPTQTGERIKITVPYARRGGIAATLTASEEGVRYESSKPGVISVDENGVIRLEKLCLFCKTATITAYSADGQKVASCVVNVRHAWWQYIIWFFFGSFWF